jgi:hypothetical protein
MKSVKKIITAIFLLMAILTALSCQNDNNIDWKISLENFLTQYPTLFEDIRGTYDISKATDILGNAPYKVRFQDLDGDDIPEIIISFYPPAAGSIVYDKIYKLYGDAYEQIEHILKVFTFYINKDGKLVAETRNGDMVSGIYFAEIKDKKLILSDYIDSGGNDNYNGVKYSDLTGLHSIMDIWTAADVDNTLAMLPEIDGSAIVSSARNRINSDN